MTRRTIAAAMQRMEEVLRRRPQAGLQTDAPAAARWESGTRVATRLSNGTELWTNMPEALGGSGGEVTPGWLFRAGLASCLATCVALHAAAQGIELASLEVVAASRSDTRGLLGMRDAGGEAIGAAPEKIELAVHVAAPGVAAERLRTLVETSHRCSPVAMALNGRVPVTVHVVVDPC